MAGIGREGLLVDFDTGMLRPDRVLVQRAPGMVLFLGAGPRAERLRRFAFDETGEDNAFIARCRRVADAVELGRLAKARRAGVPHAVLAISDPTLRRLAIAEALAKAGYDPDEPRDDQGRWTGGGTSTRTDMAISSVASGVGSTLASDVATLFDDVAPEVLEGLSTLGASFAVPAAFLGTLFIPTNDPLTRDGTLPNRPDIAYHYDLDTGTLTLSQNGLRLYSGRTGTDGVFRDGSGHAFGRRVDGSLVLDPDALPGVLLSSSTSAPDRTEARSLIQADTERGEPKLCPTPTAENIEGRSKQAIAYQEQITQLPPGFDITIIDPNTGRPRRYDGCCINNIVCQREGNLLEAKAKGYDNKMDASGVWKYWFSGLAKTQDQMQEQDSTAKALGRIVEWHFAEPRAAAYFKEYARENELWNTDVIETPAKKP